MFVRFLYYSPLRLFYPLISISKITIQTVLCAVELQIQSTDIFQHKAPQLVTIQDNHIT